MTETAAGCRLEARGLTVAYGDMPVLKGLSVGVATGRLTALLGPNGCGKSTLLRALAGLLRPDAGHLSLDAEPLPRLSRRQIARRLSLLPQSPRAPEEVSVRDLVAQGRYPHRGLFDRWSAADDAACAEALAMTDMADLAERPLGSLSGGQRQRAWIAMTLAQATDILLLDEPTTYLDIAHQLDVLALMRRLVRVNGKTVVAVLHDINQAAAIADVMVFMKDGRLAAAGAPHEVLNAATIRDVFGVAARIVEDPVDGTPFCLTRP